MVNINAAKFVTLIDPMTRGLKVFKWTIRMLAFTRVTLIDPMTRGLKDFSSHYSILCMGGYTD